VAENRGEGIFIQFKGAAIKAWEDRAEVNRRAKEIEGAYNRTNASTQSKAASFPGAAYLMLHSLSHLLMTSISLECGYPSSSLRERIYAPNPDRAEMTGCYGILIYTSSSDAQGTLGGLAAAARDIERHLRRACEMGRLCSNDPVCASHRPGEGSLDSASGSACHGCLFISETSCEQFNRFLDRSLVVQTIENLGCEFFTPPP
jgi:hypothetical protein